MSKASKNGTGSGDDERNMHFRRHKSTNNPSQVSSSIVTLAEKQAESESSSRLKSTGIATKNESVAVKNNQKSKLRPPVQIGLGQSTNRINKPISISSNKEVKKVSGPIKIKNQITKMKPEPEALEQKSLNMQSENKESTEQVENNQQVNEVICTNEQKEISNKQENENELNGRKENDSNHNGTTENGKTEQNGTEVLDTNEKEEEFNLHLEPEDNSNKLKEEASKDSLEKNHQDLLENEQKLLGEEKQENSQTVAETCSVDVVESTTSEASEATELIGSSENKNKDNQNQDVNSDAISYDSSIMLKDVKIKLNDCLKDPKAEEENNIDQNTSEYAHKEATFGRTLRTISGRNSLGRMRHITLRDRQPSPNSSLFVNTSNISLSEDFTSDYKVLHHRNTLLELSSSNGGTPIDRKRKLIQESLIAKKQKTEGNNLLNTSFELLKYPFSMRRPVQVSTPCQLLKEKNNLNLSEELKTEESGIVGKWCVIM